jgi:predicted  nucleic acid-binding Zn-ribbon protein
VWPTHGGSLARGGVTSTPVSTRRIERRLRQVGERLRVLRDELRIIDEQYAHLADEADDLEIRAMVAETPVAGVEYRDAKRHAEAMARHRAEVLAAIAELEARQDQLLDRLVG